MVYRIRKSIKEEKGKNRPKARTEIKLRTITGSKAEIQVAQDGRNLVETQVEKVEKAKKCSGVKMILK